MEPSHRERRTFLKRLGFAGLLSAFFPRKMVASVAEKANQAAPLPKVKVDERAIAYKAQVQ
jgi:hypothetical protein